MPTSWSALVIPLSPANGMNADRHTNAIMGCRDRLDTVEILKLGRDAYHMTNASIFGGE